ncbi:MAG: hypothetical protein K6E71_10695 [Lachnospiraceae bacterium]|nr:hypothetical protein [Lachnospiraceae bacterium]
MEFDVYAKQYDDNFMGKGSRRFYRNLLKELEIADGVASWLCRRPSACHSVDYHVDRNRAFLAEFNEALIEIRRTSVFS